MSVLAVFVILGSYVDCTSDSLQCYECATWNITRMAQSYIDTWERLTERSLEDVPVTLGCQDPSLAPNGLLQDCTGVCLTTVAKESAYVYRTCITVIDDCSELRSNPDSPQTYECSKESNGNSEKHIIQRVQNLHDNILSGIMDLVNSIEGFEAPLIGTTPTSGASSLYFSVIIFLLNGLLCFEIM